MENLEPEFILLTNQTKNYFKTIAKWARLLSIIGLSIFAICLLILVYAIGSNGFSKVLTTAQLLLFAIGLMLSLITCYAIYKMYIFSKYCNKAVRLNDSMLFEISIQNLKQYFKIVGTITLIFAIIFALFFLFLALGFTMANSFVKL